jgi:uncharacterized protein
MKLPPPVFFTIVTLLFAGVHAYLWWRLVRSTTAPGRTRRIGTAVVAGLGLLAAVTFVVTRSVGVDATWLAWPGYVWIAVLLYLALTLLVLEVPRLVLLIRQRARARRIPVAAGGPSTVDDRPMDVPDPDRRLLLARAFAVTAGIVAVGAVSSGMRTAFGPLRVDRVDVLLRGLDPRLDGFRVAVVGDVHIGPFMRAGFAERVVAAVDGERPDLVAVVGDLVDGSVGSLREAVRPFGELRAPHGAYFVTGNHEYSSGAPQWLDAVSDLGLRPLRNERLEVAANGAAFDLAGVNDAAARLYDPSEAPDYAAALGGRSRSRPLILLAHQPAQVREASRYGVDLQLSGHTHGGQTSPIDRITGLLQPVVAGLGTVDGTQLYVTRGAGFFGPPVRTGVAPEISVIRLRAAAR